MKYCILYSLLTFATLLWSPVLCHKITAEQFTWKLIENSLNLTKSTENFVIAPYEAYKLYKDIFNIEDESEEESSQQNEEDDKVATPELTTIMPAIRKHQKTTVSSNQTNHLDFLSSISLTARWSFNFQTRDTHKRVFHQYGKPNQKIWMDCLRKDDTFYYSHNEQLNASILELPLNVKAIKLTIILPDKWDALPQLKEYLLENMDDFNDLITKTNRMTLVRLLLPKFQLSYKRDLTEFFEQVSAKEVDKYENVYQSANLEFNERGIGRFERTTVLFWNAYSYLRVTPELFDMSHPFLFLITNKDGIQFFGQVVKMQHS